MSVYEWMAQNGVFIPVPGGGLVYLYSDEPCVLTLNYNVGTVHYSGTVTRDAGGTITVNIHVVP
jgi:hypothetical protein